MLETGTLGLILFGSLVFLIASFLMGDYHMDTGDVGGHSADFGNSHQGVTTSELFNLRNLALLAAGYSAASIIAGNADYGPFWVNIAGVCGALIMVVIGIWLFRVIRRQESNSITNNTDFVGRTAIVTSGIPEQGFGEITLRNRFGVSTSLNAKSKGPLIPAGTEVKITAVNGNIATVQ